MPNACKRPLVLRTTSKFSARARLLVRLHDRNHRMEAKIHIDRSGPPGGGTPCPAVAVPAPHSPLTPSCLLQGPPQDKRVRAERAPAAASRAVPPLGGPGPHTCGLSLPRRFRRFNILTSSSKTLLAGDSPQDGLVCDFQYLVGVPTRTPGSSAGWGSGAGTPAPVPG